MYESSGGLKQSGIAGHCPLNPSLRSQAEGWRETCFLPCCLFKNFLKLHLFIMSVCTHMWRLEDSLRDLVLSCAVWPRDQTQAVRFRWQAFLPAGVCLDLTQSFCGCSLVLCFSS